MTNKNKIKKIKQKGRVDPEVDPNNREDLREIGS